MSVDLSATNLVLAGLPAAALVGSLVLAARTHLPWGRGRLAAMIAFRSLLLAALAAWCLDLRLDLSAASGKMELIVLADRSVSISSEAVRSQEEWISRARAALGSRGSVSVIEFGRPTASATEGLWGWGVTDLAEAIGAARGRFTGKAPKRLLILSDGRYTTADPAPQASRLKAEGGAQIFAVPCQGLDGESLVADLNVPASAWQSVPLPVEAVLQADRPTTAKLSFRVDGEGKAVRSVQLPAGSSTVVFMTSFAPGESPGAKYGVAPGASPGTKHGVHQVEVSAQFGHDRLEEDNTVAAPVAVPLAPRVVIITNPYLAPGDSPGARLKAALARSGMQVAVAKPEELPNQLACDCLVLNDVPAAALGDARMKAIEGFVREGGSIIFAGGPHAYAAGGYVGSPLEPVFPVMLVPNKEQPPFALAIVFDNSWSMNEAVAGSVGKINIAKEIAIAAAEGLNKGDLVALVSFDSDYHDIIAPVKVDNLDPARYEISRIGAFGMTNILGGLQQGARLLPGMDAVYRHILLISDGKETEVGTDYSRLLSQLERASITLSTIAVGSNANDKLMNTLAFAGKGRYYHSRTIQEIPQAVLQEARSLENQLVVRMPLPVVRLEDDPAISGLDVANWPALPGYNRSRARPHAWTPLAISRKRDPLLARMRYGRGQALAWLSSASTPYSTPGDSPGATTHLAPGDSPGVNYATFWRQAVASVLPRPCRELPVECRFAAGRPLYKVAAGEDRLAVSRLVGGKIVTEPAANRAEIPTEASAAILISSPPEADPPRAGKALTNRAFAWRRTFGAEFGDVQQGRQTLAQIAELGGGQFDPSPQAVFDPGKQRLTFRIEPWMYLVLAAAMLIADLFVRRLPALAALRSRNRTGPKRAAKSSVAVFLAAVGGLVILAAVAGAMEVEEQGSKLIITGTHFRYTWDTRRGGELAVVEQPGLARGGWWNRGVGRVNVSGWQRVNSSFAWKSLDTIPAISFSTKRAAYYSLEWAVAQSNADNKAELKVLSKTAEEVVFETASAPKIFENKRLPVPWRVRQVVRVYDTGVVLIRFEIALPKGEVYELDWAQMGVNLDDSLYKEPNPDYQAHFQYGWAFPGEAEHFFQSYKPVLQAMAHLPMDIDVKPQDTILTEKPLLYGMAGYDLTHVKGAACGGFAECSLEDARPLAGGKDDFGSYVMIRPQSGMSPVPTWEGSMRNRVCFGVCWNLFDGKTLGLNEPLTYSNTLSFAVGSRKRSSFPDAPADDRNVLLGARVYYAKDALPTVDQVKAMAAEGCDTLILGAAWRKDPSAAKVLADAAHAAGMRAGGAVEAKDLGGLLANGNWFSQVFSKARDGLLVLGAHFLSGGLPSGEVQAGKEALRIRQDGLLHSNAAPLAVAMRTLRGFVGRRGFLVGETAPLGPSLLSLADCDLHASDALKNFRWASVEEHSFRRHRAGAGFAPMTDSLGADFAALAVVYGDTPLVLWPGKDKKHLDLWRLYQRLPAKGSRIESDLLPIERRFTCTGGVHGSLFDGGDGRMVLLLASGESKDSAKVAFAIPVAAAKAADGSSIAVADNAIDAGAFEPWQVKLFEITGKEGGE